MGKERLLQLLIKHKRAPRGNDQEKAKQTTQSERAFYIKRNITTYLSGHGEWSYSFGAIRDWVAYQKAAARENILRSENRPVEVIAAASEETARIAGKMTAMESHPRNGDYYIKTYREFENRVFSNVLRFVKMTHESTGNELFDIAHTRFTSAQFVQECHPAMV
jgi:hypothetical protein